MQKHVNCGAFGSVDKITCHILILFIDKTNSTENRNTKKGKNKTKTDFFLN